ncbi:DnaD domain protein [Aerococcaceae bacterium DSM 111020]|nr:DnaD domain protein [Aerococcaceae bacterium DSM 111020]
MSNRIAPMQPFYLVNSVILSPLHLQSLTHFYQPIIGPIAMSVYLTWMHVPVDSNHQSKRVVHNQCIEQMKLTMHQLDDAVKSLEAIGLLKTYRDRQSHEDPRRQTLYYHLQIPYDPQGFINQTALRAVLFHQIGPHNYEALLEQFTPEPAHLEHYDELTTPFNQWYQFGSEIPDNQTQLQSDYPQASKHLTVQSSFDYGKFLEFVMADKINHRELTEDLKSTVMNLHQVYQLNESQMAEVIKLAKNGLTGVIDHEQLIPIIEKRRQQARQVPKVSSNEFPKNYTEEERQQRKQTIQKEYPSITDKQQGIILLCEQMPAETFLTKTKEAKKGFPSDNEWYFIRDLTARSELSLPAINLLIYYLLVMQEQPNVLKGMLQRIANDWQQKGLLTPEKIFDYLNQQSKMEKTKQTNYRHYPNKKQQSQYSEPIPDWLKQQEQKAPQENETTANEIDPQSQEEIRSRLAELYREEQDH